jgi:hypothetical protein
MDKENKEEEKVKKMNDRTSENRTLENREPKTAEQVKLATEKKLTLAEAKKLFEAEALILKKQLIIEDDERRADELKKAEETKLEKERILRELKEAEPTQGFFDFHGIKYNKDMNAWNAAREEALRHVSSAEDQIQQLKKRSVEHKDEREKRSKLCAARAIEETQKRRPDLMEVLAPALKQAAETKKAQELATQKAHAEKWHERRKEIIQHEREKAQNKSVER